MSETPQYEYKTVKSGVPSTRHYRKQRERLLNKMANKGWELDSQQEERTWGTKDVLVFRRPKGAKKKGLLAKLVEEGEQIQAEERELEQAVSEARHQRIDELSETVKELREALRAANERVEELERKAGRGEAKSS